MNDILNKRERHDYLIDELTSLEIKLSDYLEGDHIGDEDFRKSILEKDIRAVKEELESLTGIDEEFQNKLAQYEVELRNDKEFKLYFQGIEKVDEELDQKIQELNSLVGFHGEVEESFEKYLKGTSAKVDLLNNSIMEYKKKLLQLKGYDLVIDFKGISENNLENWQSFQKLIDTKESIKESINSLISQKLELQRLKEEFIIDKMKK